MSVFEEVRGIMMMMESLGIKETMVTPSAKLCGDFPGVDSLGAIDVIAAVEKGMNIELSTEEFDGACGGNVEDLCRLVESHRAGERLIPAAV